MSSPDLSWTAPVMRAGYAGRGLVYLVIAGFALFAIARGERAEGTGSALEKLETSAWGLVVLALIAAGMAAYAVWRLVDAWFDLEDYGHEIKGVIARIGMVVTGLIHLAIGFAAAAVLFTRFDTDKPGSGSTIAEWTAKIMSLPAGIQMVGIAGALTVGAGIYYTVKAVGRTYQDHLRSNTITRRWDWILRLGVLGQAVVVTLIGAFLTYAAFTADPEHAGGLQKVFDWLNEQAFGPALVAAVAVALVCFAIFCVVNALYRIIPKVDGDSVESLSNWAQARMREATGRA
ncbi:membrane protein [Loktanella sp. 22II-4b]|nr:DUF1206 domain-containing protein [Brevirhabdus pacifica]OWU79978.1 membrane protein [Loktanella sp. 22II-4b]PJJ86766.1 uncharacterized protein DUF1206 [Brevirhabdus pacifica]